ncbi:MAG: hypothetical protein HYR94_11495 [Chloroflexi bacterium]|nr:hypothetical protein [Chloroflexota bacterium]
MRGAEAILLANYLTVLGLKEQSPLGWSLARRALPFQRDGFSLTLLRLKLEFANRILKPPH